MSLVITWSCVMKSQEEPKVAEDKLQTVNGFSLQSVFCCLNFCDLINKRTVIRKNLRFSYRPTIFFLFRQILAILKNVSIKITFLKIYRPNVELNSTLLSCVARPVSSPNRHIIWHYCMLAVSRVLTSNCYF
jgi:hypothetical protein